MKKKLINLSLLTLFLAISINLLYPMKNNADDIQNITINQPISLNYKSKEEIYNIRKSYVAKSIFADTNYQPSEEVFGGIEDFKPWISMDWCFNYNPNDPNNWVLKTDGPSSHSRSLINPSLPVLLEYPFAIPDVQENRLQCNQISQLMVPLSAVYSKTNKEVDITYRNLVKLDDRTAYQITAVNARDFGYNYMYVDKSKSTLNIQYLTNDNVSTDVKEISDFIHLGGACKVSSGCNNWSRTREDLQFRYLGSTKGVNHPQLYIKLWKEMPSSPYADADLNVKLIFGTSTDVQTTQYTKSSQVYYDNYEAH